MRRSDSFVTAIGIRLREMRLLVHRGQALLLLVVGALAGAAVTGAVLERGGFTLPGAFDLAGIVAPPATNMPARIVIGSGTTSSDSGVVAGASPVSIPAPVGPEPTGSQSTAAAPARSPGATTVVPAAVYTYPPDGRGGGGSGRGGPGGGGPSPTPAGGSGSDGKSGRG
jgi:hypothetical protein